MLVNKYRTNGNLVYIELTKGQETVIEQADLEKALQYTWFASYNKTIDGYYAMRRTETGGSMYLHRFLLDAPKGMYVDHVNHDTLDNRRSNLKLCTNQENNVNRNGAYSASKTGIRGVSVHVHAPNKTTRQRHNPNPSGKMYVFRCHCVTCKIAKYFPYTDEGLEEARVFAEAHYAATKKE